MTENYYDITVIGGGPVGMFCATFASMHTKNVQLIESLAVLGGQPNTLYPKKKIYDVPGFLGLTGEQLTKKLKNQLEEFGANIYLNEKVTMITKTTAGFKITSENRTSYSKKIIIATGLGSFVPRKLPLKNLSPTIEDRLTYFVDDFTKFTDKTIAIAGGGDSAIDWGLELAEFAKDLHVIHRRDQFRALPTNIDKLKAKQANFQTPFTINEITITENKQLTLSLLNKKAKEEKQLQVDELIVSYGFMSNNSFLKDWGLELDQRGILVNQQMETSIPGIFAIGDCAQYPGRADIMATGFGEGPLAVNNALKQIYPDQYVPTHSTTLMEDK